MKVGKRGHCLCCAQAGDPGGAVGFLPFYTVSLSVPLFGQSPGILFSKQQAGPPPPPQGGDELTL